MWERTSIFWKLSPIQRKGGSQQRYYDLSWDMNWALGQVPNWRGRGGRGSEAPNTAKYMYCWCTWFSDYGSQFRWWGCWLHTRVLQRPIFLETTQGKPGTLLITPIFPILAPKICQKLNLGGWTTQLKIFHVVFHVVLQNFVTKSGYVQIHRNFLFIGPTP